LAGDSNAGLRPVGRRHFFAAMSFDIAISRITPAAFFAGHRFYAALRHDPI
jgi:hypothetical protein